MANFETFRDLKNAALDRAGELTDGSSDYDSIVEDHMNSMYRSIFSGGNEFSVDLGEVWEWALASAPGVLTILPAFESGSVTFTNGSTSGTFSSAPSSSLGSFAGRFIFINSRSSIYRITAHTAGDTAFTIDQEYLETTGSGLTFKAIKLDYDLTSGIERLVQEMRVYKGMAGDDSNGKIPGIDFASFDRMYPRFVIGGGTPERFCERNDVDGLKTVRFSHYPSESIRAEYEYIPKARKLITKSIATTDINTTTNVITSTNHGFQDNDRIKMTTSTTMPGGLAVETVYFIRDAAADTFKLTSTLAGSAIDITSTGTGTHTVSSIPAIPHAYRKVLFYVGAHFICMDKSDSRADYYARMTQSTLQAMVSANRKVKRHVGKNKGRLISRMDSGGMEASLQDRIPWSY